MNRLSPLIARQDYTPARPFSEWHAPAAEAPPSTLAKDVRLFLTGWVGGLIFFGTLLL
jgi:hypothetical protein